MIVVEIVSREQHLCHMDVIVAEIFLVCHQQLDLPDGAQRLLVVDIAASAPFVDRSDSADTGSR